VEVVRSFEDLRKSGLVIGVEVEAGRLLHELCCYRCCAQPSDCGEGAQSHGRGRLHAPEHRERARPATMDATANRRRLEACRPGRDPRDVRVLSSERFYPYGWQEEYSPACVTEKTYAVHHWASTWTGNASIIIPCYNQARRYLPEAIESARWRRPRSRTRSIVVTTDHRTGARMWHGRLPGRASD